MKSTILELNQSRKYAGRTNIKWVILELHNSTNQYNRNGITWKKEYVMKNIDSAKSMPIAVEFLDLEESEPHGHGLSDVKDGVPLFEYSTVVGVTEDAYVDTIEINGESKEVLIGTGYLYNQRYPKFVQWLKSKMYDGDFPDTSVEICAKEGNDVIIYEDGWKEKGRVPMIFDFSGDCLLGIEPADPSAVLLEINANKQNNYKEDFSMSGKDQNSQLVTELNEKIEAKVNEISELKSQLKEVKSAKESEVNELQKQLETKTNELNEQIEEKTSELNSTVEKLKDVESKLEKSEKQVKDMEKELNELREFKQKTENEKIKSELNTKLKTYTDEEKEVVKEKLEKFEKEPTQELANEIVNEINSNIAKKIVEERANAQSNEQNSQQADDIYSDVMETNNDNSPSIEDLY